ncbi:MAG: ATP-binding protein, partial [Isosphaeraceae bacterium]
AGADDFLTKPFDRVELRVRLRAGERIIRLEYNLRETQATLLQTEQLASLGRLAAGLAHEINNPIAYVANNLAVLRRDVLAAMGLLDKYREGRVSLADVAPELAAEVLQVEEEIDLNYLRENLNRLFNSTAEGLQRVRGIVRNLRDFARLDEAEYKEVDLNAALQSTLEALRHEADLKGVRIQTDFQELPPLACYPLKLNQVFLNVLLNAIQASEREGVIELRTRLEGRDAVVVEIEDHGGGIHPEHLPHIFEPFFTTKPVGAGAGLGLSVSYGIVRDHGGSFDVVSDVGKGSRFRITLPRRTLRSEGGSKPASVDR